MASVNFALDVIEDDPGRHGRQEYDGPLVKYYRVSGLIPAPEDPLHKLMKREPAVWAAVQVSSGILSVALGVMFAVSFNIGNMFLTLFRVPIISGILFLVAGFFSALLYRNPALLQMCFQSNIICLGAAAVGAVLLCVDLGKDSQTPEHQVEILVLCVTLLDMLVSFVLILLIRAEKRRQEKK